MPQQPANTRRLKARRFGQPPASEVAPAGSQQPGRDARGRFVAENRCNNPTASLTHGLRSTHVAAALEPVRQAIVQSVLDSRGYDDQHPPAPTYRALVEQFARVQLHVDQLDTYIADSGGLLSRKGHVRRCVPVYLGLIDRLMRLAGTIGLTRQPRPVHGSALDQLHAEARALDVREPDDSDHSDETTADPDTSDLDLTTPATAHTTGGHPS